MRGVNIMRNQLRGYKTTRLLSYLMCGLLTFALFNGPAWSAESANKLVSVSVDPDAATPTILVKTSDPVGYRYTVYDSFEPTRVVIDFPGMVLSEMEETVAVNLGTVQEVRVAGFDLSSGKLARVEILLTENTEYQVNLDKNEFRVAFATSKASAETVAQVAVVENISVDPGQDAQLLKNIVLSPGQAVLETNGKVGKHQFFALGNPPRLVVDLYGIRPAFKERAFSAQAGFDQVRVGTYSDKTRLVFDASGKTLPEHLVEAGSTDIMVSWGGKSSATAEPVSMAPQAAAPAATVQPVVAIAAPVTQAPTRAGGPVAVEALDFSNEDGRSVISLNLSGYADVSAPVEDGNLVRFEIIDATISRALRRTIDASAFPSAVASVTPYTVAEGDHQNVRIAVSLKGPVAYALEQDGRSLRLVVDDGAYAEPLPPAVSQVEVVAPEVTTDSEVRVTPIEDFNTSGDETISLDFVNADIRNLLRLIGDVSGMNIVASDKVQGNMTMRLIDVPWSQALDLVLTTNGLMQLKDGNVAHILTKDEYNTRQQALLDNQVKNQEASSKLKIRETIKIQYVNMDAITEITKRDPKDPKTSDLIATVNKATKTVVLYGNQPDVESMIKTIAEMDKPEKQVMIEVRIVEASTTHDLDFGVKWGASYQDPDGRENTDVMSSNLGLGGSFAISPPIGGVMSNAGAALGISFGALGIAGSSLDLRLSALEGNGDIKVVSTPRILTLNGNAATITQGRQIPYTTTGTDGTPTTEFKDATLNLTVTPEINPNGSIILDLNLTNDTQGPNVASGSGSAPAIEKKTAKTKLLVRDGDTTVIGGIFVDSEDTSNSGVPLVKDIPVLGHLFKSTNKKTSRRELLIFITPRIIASE